CEVRVGDGDERDPVTADLLDQLVAAEPAASSARLDRVVLLVDREAGLAEGAVYGVPHPVDRRVDRADARRLPVLALVRGDAVREVGEVLQLREEQVVLLV